MSFNVASCPPFHPLRSTSVPSTLKMPLSRVTSAVSGFILLGCPHSLVLMTALSFRKPLFPQGSLYIIPILSILVLILPHHPSLVFSRWPGQVREGIITFIQSCPTLCDPMDCSLPGSSLHGILQARVLDRGSLECNPEIPAFPGEEY